jgi:hypothetical protein
MRTHKGFIMRNVYLLMFVLGTIFPVVCFSMHFTNGQAGGWPQFWAAPFATWVISGFSWDLILTATTATIWMVSESRRLQMKGILWQILLIFAIGICCSLPLFMLRREGRLQQQNE